MAKFRLYMDTPKGAGQFLSIMETAKGDLIIFPARPDQGSGSLNVSTGGEQSIENVFKNIDTSRISVHVSPSAAGHTIVDHQFRTDGTRTRWYSCYEFADANKLWLLCVSRAPELSLPRYTLKKKGGDRVICCGTYDPRCCSLFYGLFVSAPEVVIDILPQFQSRSLVFRHFALHAVFAFSATPTAQRSAMLRHVTALREDGPQSWDKTISDNALSSSSPQLGAEILSHLQTLALINAVEFAKEASKNGVTIHPGDLPVLSALRRFPVPPSLIDRS